LVPFYDLCDHLRNFDIEVGVAIPGVKKYTDEDPEEEIKDSKSSKKKNGSKIFGLIIKSRGVSIIYHYEPNDKSENKMKMKFTIECLKILLGKQTHSERIFWNAYCEIKGIDMVLTKQNALFLNKTLMGMKEAERIEVKNKTNMRYYLEKEGNETRLFVPLDGLDTVKESVRMLLCLKHSELLRDIEWTVGSLDLDEFNSAPFLFVIKKRKIKLVITDVLDVCIVWNCINNLVTIIKTHESEYKTTKKNYYGIQKLRENDNNTIFDTYDFNYKKVFKDCLSVENLSHTFNKEKAKYALEVYKMLTKHKLENVKIDEDFFKIPKIILDNKLEDTLKAIRLYIRGDFDDSFKLFKFFKNKAIKSDNSIEKLLEDFGFNDIQIEKSGQKWEELVDKLKKHKRWKFFRLEDLENLIDVCEINKNKENIQKESIYEIDESKSSLHKENVHMHSREKLKEILKRCICSISMNYKIRDEINKYSEKGHFFTVLELLNNFLYRENFISFNENLTRIVQIGKNSNMIKEMDLINELASKNDNIFSNMRYNKYKESVNEIKGNYVISNFRFQILTFRESLNKFKYELLTVYLKH
jgi:hypothetical protein